MVCWFLWIKISYRIMVSRKSISKRINYMIIPRGSRMKGEQIRKELDLRPESSTDVEMKLSKWKNFLIEGNIPRNIDVPGGYIKALEAFM
jgi:hypothetical protein